MKPSPPTCATNMHAADTNVLVRLLVRDDAAQTAAAERFTAAGAWVSTLVLAETIWVLRARYTLSPKALATAVEFLLQHRSLTLQEPGLAADALALFKLHPRLGFSDCLVLEAARRAGHLPLGTFDRNLGRAPGAQKL